MSGELLISNAFSAVSLILFFYSVLFVSSNVGTRDAKTSSTAMMRSTILLIAADVLAVYQIVTGQTTSGGVALDPLTVMVAAGSANLAFALSASGLM